MTPQRFADITGRYPSLRLALIGDFCLDRYFDIDPAIAETSIETGLPVHNITRVRCQPGAAGTILNNLVALGVGEIRPVGFCGDDAEGWALRRSLSALPGVRLDGFLTTPERCTFTYTKPLLQRPGQPPEELSRLDQKNFTPTPPAVRAALAQAITRAWDGADASIVLDQVDLAGTGVVAAEWFPAGTGLAGFREGRLIVADSRRGLRDWPPIVFKMNAAELAKLSGRPTGSLDEVAAAARDLARANGQPVFITLAERGIVGADAAGATAHVPAQPVRGPIDIVGAGDSVTANLTAALAADATLTEAMELAMAGASVVIHQLGTTGTASPGQLRTTLFGGNP